MHRFKPGRDDGLTSADLLKLIPLGPAEPATLRGENDAGGNDPEGERV